MTTIELPDGRVIALGEFTQGGSKNETRFGRMPDGTEVVVKVQRNHGRLRNEAAALRFLASHPVRVPRVIASATLADGAEVLVVTRAAGDRTYTPEGWRQSGRDLAALVGLDTAGWPLETIGTAEFCADHRDRLREIEALLARDVAAAITGALETVSTTRGLVIAHGDPGGGNYVLAAEGTGTLLDWETAVVAPFGLDIGRAAFIGLLDLSGSGLPRQLAAAVVDGYRAGLAPGIEIDDAVLRSWTIVAGLQFIHGRFTRPLLAERTPQAAVEVLERFLA